jgi:hypothetical protein
MMGCAAAAARWLEVLRCISRWELLQQIASGMPTDAVLFAAAGEKAGGKGSGKEQQARKLSVAAGAADGAGAGGVLGCLPWLLGWARIVVPVCSLEAKAAGLGSKDMLPLKAGGLLCSSYAWHWLCKVTGFLARGIIAVLTLPRRLLPRVLLLLLLAGGAKSMDTMAMSEASIKRAHIGELLRTTQGLVGCRAQAVWSSAC